MSPPNISSVRPKRGRALILVGPQGSGKSRMARQIAGQMGRVEEIDGHMLEDARALAARLISQPAVLIVDGYIPGSALPILKRLVTEKTMSVRLAYSAPSVVKTPLVIVCTHAWPQDSRIGLVHQLGGHP